MSFGKEQWRIPHWDTYVNLCHPCSVKFDFIGRVETLNRDGPLIMAHLPPLGGHSGEAKDSSTKMKHLNHKSSKDSEIMTFAELQKIPVCGQNVV